MAKTVYIAGPMRGYKHYNFPSFDHAAETLERDGHKVISPADMDRDLGLDPFNLPYDHDWDTVPGGFDFRAAVERDLGELMDCDAVLLLKGWEESNGAQAEAAVARWMGKEIWGPEYLAPPFCEDAETEDTEFDTGSKPSNPKDIIGSDKLPMHLWPSTASMMGCIALLNGALKYGRGNFRAVGIRASIYRDALQRHMDAWWEGEEFDKDDGVPHLSAALACLAIIVDAQAAGKMVDDRNIKGGYGELRAALTPLVAELKEQHEGKNPKHYTTADNEETD